MGSTVVIPKAIELVDEVVMAKEELPQELDTAVNGGKKEKPKSFRDMNPFLSFI